MVGGHVAARLPYHRTMSATNLVSSFNEWDPLEEVIVGVSEGSCELPWDLALESVMPSEAVDDMRKYFTKVGGRLKNPKQNEPAIRELDELVRVLEAEGVTVRRPERLNLAAPYSTPDWTSPSGNAQIDPRDVLIVIGNEIIEAPMAWRSRYFEFRAYRKLLNEYFQKGAKWTAVPKPLMTDELYDKTWKRGVQSYVTTEVEPVFDAADITRCGRDLFMQRSQVTNDAGIEWMRRHLGDQYRVHKVEFADDRSIHIDATFVPLAPGKILINPDRPIIELPEIFKGSGWEFLTPTRSTLEKLPLYRSFEWLHVNVLMLDEKRIIVEKQEEPFIAQLKDWGFTPIPVAFRHNHLKGGGFHCATVDIRRRGTLKSYF